MGRVNLSILMEEYILVLLSKVYPAEKEDLSVRKDGTTKVNFTKNKLKEEEFSAIRAQDIDMKDSGKEICQMEEENKLGSSQVLQPHTKDNMYLEKSMVKEYIRMVKNGFTKASFLTTN